MCGRKRPPLDTDPMKLSEGLVNDCLTTVMDCARATLERGFREVESQHPIVPGEGNSGVVNIPGASGLWVWFDARCNLEVHEGAPTHASHVPSCARLNHVVPIA